MLVGSLPLPSYSQNYAGGMEEGKRTIQLWDLEGSEREKEVWHPRKTCQVILNCLATWEERPPFLSKRPSL